MKTLSALVGGIALLCVASVGAHAQAVKKTWVSSTGVDTGTCPLTAPCASFAYAVTQTVASGELDVKDSGAYGAFTITQSISVVAADGVLATVGMATGANGVTVKAGTEDIVILQGLTIDGHNTGTFGVDVQTAQNVSIRSVAVKNVTYGIYLDSGFVMILDSAVIGGHQGVTNSYNANVYIGNTQVTGAAYGLYGSLNSYGNNYINGNTSCDTCKATVTTVPRL